MNVVLFRPIDGDPNILVATLSGVGRSAAAIVTRTPAQDPSWPATWSYQIAGDVTRPPSDPYSNERAAVEAAAVRLCAVLDAGRLGWFIDRPDDVEVPHWGERTAADAVAEWRSQHTVTTYAPEQRSLVSRFRGVWKAWRL